MERSLKVFFYTSIFASVMSVGCSQNPVEVVISPTEYRVNDISSPLATPVVDEVVRIKPKQIIIIKCPKTPNAKIFQFDTELVARLNTKIQIANVNQGQGGCP